MAEWIVEIGDGEPHIKIMEKLVRCKDCKWGKEACSINTFGNIECFVDLNAPSEYHGYTWFCPNGEEK